ncbi:MAG TPA: transglutaminase domain-containing protein [Candidatus Acidoferrales bacterium]|nr:transglutaminase domain-containing protein [Candidatus Acidoferrales bacterium]
MNLSHLRRVALFSLDILIALSVAIFCGSLFWEFSTEQYLSGFADAIVPAGASQTEKATAILDWIAGGPARSADADPDPLFDRDPRSTLNYRGLLNTCGTATNAFVNLARRGGLRARRLLLFDGRGNTTHVVAEVKIQGQWIVVDPLFHFIARDASGRLLTREDLKDPQVLRQATAGVRNYLAAYSYASTGHVRLARVPLIGSFLQDSVARTSRGGISDWDWTLPLERESFAAVVVSFATIFLALAFRKIVRLVLRSQFRPLSESLPAPISSGSPAVLVHNQ